MSLASRIIVGQRKLWLVTLGGLAAAVLGFIPGLGIPGMVMVLVGDAVLQATVGVFGYPSATDIPGDGLWQMALLMTLTLLPFSVTAYVIAFRLCASQQRWKQWMVWWMVLVCWCVVGTAALQRLVGG